MEKYQDNVDASLAQLKTIFAARLTLLQNEIKSSKNDIFKETSTFIVNQLYQYIVDINNATIDQISGRLEQRLREFKLTLSNDSLNQIRELLTVIETNTKQKNKEQKNKNTTVIDKLSKLFDNNDETDNKDNNDAKQEETSNNIDDLIQMLSSLSLDSILDEFSDYIKEDYEDYTQRRLERARERKQKRTNFISNLASKLFSIDAAVVPAWLNSDNLNKMFKKLSGNFNDLQEKILETVKIASAEAIDITNQIRFSNLKLLLIVTELILSTIFLVVSYIFLAASVLVLAVAIFIRAMANFLVAAAVIALAIIIVAIAMIKIIIAMIYILIAITILILTALAIIVFTALILLVIAILLISVALLIAAMLFTVVIALAVLALYAVYIFVLIALTLLIIFIVVLTTIALTYIIVFATIGIIFALVFLFIALILVLTITILLAAVLITAAIIAATILIFVLAFTTMVAMLLSSLLTLTGCLVLGTLLIFLAVAIMLAATALAVLQLFAYYIMVIGIYTFFRLSIISLAALFTILVIALFATVVITYIGLMLGNTKALKLFGAIMTLGPEFAKAITDKLNEVIETVLIVFLLLIAVIIGICIYIWNIAKEWFNKIVDKIKQLYENYLKDYFAKDSAASQNEANQNESIWEKIKDFAKNVKSFFSDWFNKTPEQIRYLICDVIKEKLGSVFDLVWGFINKWNIKKCVKDGIEFAISCINDYVLSFLIELFDTFWGGVVNTILNRVDFSNDFSTIIKDCLKALGYHIGDEVYTAFTNTATGLWNGIKWIRNLFTWGSWDVGYSSYSQTDNEKRVNELKARRTELNNTNLDDLAEIKSDNEAELVNEADDPYVINVYVKGKKATPDEEKIAQIKAHEKRAIELIGLHPQTHVIAVDEE